MKPFALLPFLAALPLSAEWVSRESGTRAALRSIHFHAMDSAYACGDLGTLLRTGDGGATWTRVPTDAGDTSLIRVFFLDSRQGLVLGEGGYLARTEDGGRSWIRIAPGGGAEVFSLGGNGGGKVFVGTRRGTLLASADAGRTWAPARVQGLDTLGGATQYHFPSPEIGYATSTHGILKTADAGASWNLILSTRSPQHPSGVVLTSVFFTSPTRGFVSGAYYSTISRTLDGGLSFEKVSAAPANTVFFTAADTGYAACHGGKIYRSVDGGATWSLHHDAGRSGVILGDLHFSGPGKGIAVGDSGAIYQYRGAAGTRVRAPRGRRADPAGAKAPASLRFDTLGKANPPRGAGARILFPPD
jgi:photosystem II stability/assembly factor-like uncharacterized protein